MTTNYPNSLDAFTIKTDGIDDVMAADINNLQDAILAVQALLGGPPLGWYSSSLTWTYVSATSFTVPGNMTSIFHKGTFLKWTQTTVKYGVVLSSTYAAPNTTVTLIPTTDYALVNAAVIDPYYSYAANPSGWPGWFNYTPTATPGTGAFTTVSATGKWNATGKIMAFLLTVAITSNGTGGAYVLATLPITSVVGGFFAIGRENALTTKMVFGICGSSGVNIVNYDSTYPGGDGKTLLVDGFVQY